MESWDRALKTLTEMLTDRGYDVNVVNEAPTDCQWVIRGTYRGRKDLDVPRTIGVYYCTLNVGGIRKVDVEKQELGINRVILVSDEASTSSAKKELATLGIANFEVFLISELQYNVTKHKLYAPHVLLSPKETEELLKKYRCTLDKLPVLLKTDVVARYFGLQKNQVVRIERRLGHQQPDPFYRVVKLA